MKYGPAGFSLVYSLATTIFGGFTPAIATGLIEYTGDKGAPGMWMTAAAEYGVFLQHFIFTCQ